MTSPDRPEEDPYEAHERRAGEGWRLRPSRACACPRVVAGKRCVAYNSSKPCICQGIQHVMDHARIWLDQRGRHVLTGEPYSATGEEITALIASVAEFGLSVRLSGMSPWNPGYTFLILITKDDTGGDE